MVNIESNKLKYTPLTPLTLEMLETGHFTVRHFKREKADPQSVDALYVVQNIVEHSETGEKLVHYVSLADEKRYVRPVDMFLSKVDREKYPDIRQEYRYVTATEEDCLVMLTGCLDILKREMKKGFGNE